MPISATAARSVDAKIVPDTAVCRVSVWACIGIPTTIYLFAQMPGKFSAVWVWKCHPDFGFREKRPVEAMLRRFDWPTPIMRNTRRRRMTEDYKPYAIRKKEARAQARAKR
jgi:hypothetical protein